MTLKVINDQTKAVMASIAALTKDRVLIGIPAEKAFREPDGNDPNPGIAGAEINNAEIGYLNEFGVPELNIPPRPHLVPGVQKVLPKVEAIYRKAAGDALDGKKAEIDKAHGKVGLLAVGSVVQTIHDVIPPKLADATIAKRKAAGRTGTTPLLDTGQYQRDITYVTKSAKDVKAAK